MRNPLVSGYRAIRHRALAAGMLAEFSRFRDLSRPVRLKLLSQRREKVGSRLVYRADTPDGVFVLKMHTAPAERNPMRRDFDALERLSGYFGTTGALTVPEPLFRSSCGRCLVMPYFEGVTANNLFLSGPDPETRRDAFRRAGRWLRQLHGIEPPGTASFRPKWVFGEIERQLQQSDKDFPALAERSEIERFMSRLRPLAKDHRGAPVQTAFSHGDFSAHNLMLGPDRTCGIDFGYAGRRNAIADIADFLTFDLMFSHAKGGLGASGVQTDSYTAFCEGYGEIADPEELTFLLKARIMLKWLSIRRVRGRTHPDYGFRPEEAQARLREILGA